jgi:RecA/RadA recombinase
MSVKGENEGKGGKTRSMEEAEMALLATKMSKFLRRTSTPIYKANIAVSLVGQARTGGIGGFAPRLELSGGHMLRHMSMLTVQMRRGQGTDAPSEMVDTGEVDERGKPIKIRQKVGFDCVLEIEKTKTNSKPEGSRIHVPYLFASGYVQ